MLISGGIDISFAVAASVVQYVAFYALQAMGGDNWPLGFLVACTLGFLPLESLSWVVHERWCAKTQWQVLMP